MMKLKRDVFSDATPRKQTLQQSVSVMKTQTSGWCLDLTDFIITVLKTRLYLITLLHRGECVCVCVSLR